MTPLGCYGCPDFFACPHVCPGFDCRLRHQAHKELYAYKQVRGHSELSSSPPHLAPNACWRSHCCTFPCAVPLLGRLLGFKEQLKHPGKPGSPRFPTSFCHLLLCRSLRFQTRSLGDGAISTPEAPQLGNPSKPPALISRWGAVTPSPPSNQTMFCQVQTCSPGWIQLLWTPRSHRALIGSLCGEHLYVTLANPAWWL